MYKNKYKTVYVNRKQEVVGCWTSSAESKCRKCESILIDVPRQGHVNSPYWAYEQDDGMVLRCCPKGCLEHIDE